MCRKAFWMLRAGVGDVLGWSLAEGSGEALGRSLAEAFDRLLAVCSRPAISLFGSA